MAADERMRSATVEVPATSANLGPGFDSLGVALDWRARFTLTLSDDPTPAPAGPLERMAAAGARALHTLAGAELPVGVRVEVAGDIPVGRGLGLSAAAHTAGVVAADALLPGDRALEALLPPIVRLEGHADNAAPALLGGLQIVVEDDDGQDGVYHLGLEPPEDLRVALLVPEFSMPTRESRKRLPERLTRNQAVHNIGRAALLVAALVERRYELLAVATEDVLHQPARSTLFPAMYAIFQAARDAGAHGVYLSGGGSTVAAFASEGGERIAGAMREAAAAHGLEAQARVCAMSARGAELVEGPAGLRALAPSS